MTRYEQIMSMDVETFAAFIQGVIETTEEEMQQSVARQGYEVSLVRLAPELRLADTLRRLQEEVDDGDT